MIIFEGWHKISIDFEGHCYLSSTNVECWLIKNRTYHRLDGPACISKRWGICSEHYLINGIEYTPEDYWCNPMVIKYKLESILSIT